MSEVVTISGAGRSVTMTSEEFRASDADDEQPMLPGMPEMEPELIFWERQGSGKREIQVSLRDEGRGRRVKIVAPALLLPNEADTLRGMLARAVKATKEQ